VAGVVAGETNADGGRPERGEVNYVGEALMVQVLEGRYVAKNAHNRYYELLQSSDDTHSICRMPQVR
jgi:hypothetical protein